jgi:hypothetical protein
MLWRRNYTAGGSMSPTQRFWKKPGSNNRPFLCLTLYNLVYDFDMISVCGSVYIAYGVNQATQG